MSKPGDKAFETAMLAAAAAAALAARRGSGYAFQYEGGDGLNLATTLPPPPPRDEEEGGERGMDGGAVAPTLESVIRDRANTAHTTVRRRGGGDDGDGRDATPARARAATTGGDHDPGEPLSPAMQVIQGLGTAAVGLARGTGAVLHTVATHAPAVAATVADGLMHLMIAEPENRPAVPAGVVPALAAETAGDPSATGIAPSIGHGGGGEAHATARRLAPRYAALPSGGVPAPGPALLRREDGPPLGPVGAFNLPSPNEAPEGGGARATAGRHIHTLPSVYRSDDSGSDSDDEDAGTGREPTAAAPAPARAHTQAIANDWAWPDEDEEDSDGDHEGDSARRDAATHAAPPAADEGGDEAVLEAGHNADGEAAALDGTGADGDSDGESPTGDREAGSARRDAATHAAPPAADEGGDEAVLEAGHNADGEAAALDGTGAEEDSDGESPTGDREAGSARRDAATQPAQLVAAEEGDEGTGTAVLEAGHNAGGGDETNLATAALATAAALGGEGVNVVAPFDLTEFEATLRRIQPGITVADHAPAPSAGDGFGLAQLAAGDGEEGAAPQGEMAADDGHESGAAEMGLTGAPTAEANRADTAGSDEGDEERAEPSTGLFGTLWNVGSAARALGSATWARAFGGQAVPAALEDDVTRGDTAPALVGDAATARGGRGRSATVDTDLAAAERDEYGPSFGLDGDAPSNGLPAAPSAHVDDHIVGEGATLGEGVGAGARPRPAALDIGGEANMVVPAGDRFVDVPLDSPAIRAAAAAREALELAEQQARDAAALRSPLQLAATALNAFFDGDRPTDLTAAPTGADAADAAIGDHARMAETPAAAANQGWTFGGVLTAAREMLPFGRTHTEDNDDTEGTGDAAPPAAAVATGGGTDVAPPSAGDGTIATGLGYFNGLTARGAEVADTGTVAAREDAVVEHPAAPVGAAAQGWTLGGITTAVRGMWPFGGTYAEDTDDTEDTGHAVPLAAAVATGGGADMAPPPAGDGTAATGLGYFNGLTARGAEAADSARDALTKLLAALRRADAPEPAVGDRTDARVADLVAPEREGGDTTARPAIQEEVVKVPSAYETFVETVVTIGPPMGILAIMAGAAYYTAHHLPGAQNDFAHF
jgi:hypothetical protein